MSDRIFITEFDEVDLPPDYHFSHNVLVRLYDDLSGLFDDEKIMNKLNITVKFRADDKRPKKEEDILEWLTHNGYQKQANQILVKHLTFAIIHDICQFIHQALDSAKKMQVTVALALIRKPFLENLLIIEQLFTDEEDFLTRFNSHPEGFDPGKIRDEKKKEIISKCFSKLRSSHTLDHELIYQLRFDKKSPQSLYAITNLATHLVTTRHAEFKTESTNLNLIFSGYEDYESQLDYFYYFLPHILLYAVEIIDQQLLEKKIITLKKFKKRKFLRLMTQMIHHDTFDEKSLTGKSSINKLINTIKVKCLNCNKVNQLYKSDLFWLVQNHCILCKHCLIDLYFDSNSLDEFINKTIK